MTLINVIYNYVFFFFTYNNQCFLSTFIKNYQNVNSKKYLYFIFNKLCIIQFISLIEVSNYCTEQSFAIQIQFGFIIILLNDTKLQINYTN